MATRCKVVTKGQKKGAKMKGRFKECTVAPKTKFDSRSFRYSKRGKGWMLIGCPKGKWDPKGRYRGRPGRCKVGTRAHKTFTKVTKKKKRG